MDLNMDLTDVWKNITNLKPFENYNISSVYNDTYLPIKALPT